MTELKQIRVFPEFFGIRQFWRFCEHVCEHTLPYTLPQQKKCILFHELWAQKKTIKTPDHFIDFQDQMSTIQ